MLPLAAGRRAVIRDLDATIAILRGLSPSDRDRPTPCEGWDVRQLAIHLAQQPPVLGTRLLHCMQHPPANAAATSAQTVELASGTAWNEIVARLTTGRNQLATILAHLEVDDLKGTAGTSGSCRSIFNVIVAEFGLHRSDVEAAIGKPGGVNIETVQAANLLYGARLATMATSSFPEGPGDAPFALRLRGDDIIDLWLTWDGVSWSMTPGTAPVTMLRGSDSTIVLFMMGRIPLSDRRIGIKGNRDIAARFKTFVPGP